MYIQNDYHKFTPSVGYNQWQKCLDTQFTGPTNQDSIKVPKVFKSTNKKCYYKTLGTSIINIPIASPSLGECTVELPEEVCCQ